jgi:hypothetical protein
MRIRTIKPEFWTSEKMAQLPDFTKLLAIGLLNHADDHGYFWANPMLIRGAIFPFDEDSSKVRRSLAQLQINGYISLAKTPDGRDFGQVVNFSKHQRVDRPRDSLIAPMSANSKPLAAFDEASTNDRRSLVEASSLEGKGREGNTIAPKAARERNPLFDALAEATGQNAEQITKSAGGQIGKALAEIKAVSPEITVEQIKERAANYRTHFADVSISPSALAKWWGLCDKPKGGNFRQHEPELKYV